VWLYEGSNKKGRVRVGEAVFRSVGRRWLKRLLGRRSWDSILFPEQLVAAFVAVVVPHKRMVAVGL